MLDQTLTLPDDPEELRSFTARLLAEVKAQAILIEKLRHQLPFAEPRPLHHHTPIPGPIRNWKIRAQLGPGNGKQIISDH